MHLLRKRRILTPHPLLLCSSLGSLLLLALGSCLLALSRLLLSLGLLALTAASALLLPVLLLGLQLFALTELTRLAGHHRPREGCRPELSRLPTTSSASIHGRWVLERGV